jgi:phosphate transport system substrate-binding protein
MFAKTLKTTMFVLFVAALILTGCSRPVEEQKIVIKGSTTVLPIAQKAQEAYLAANENVTISLQGTGSGDGIKSIIEGTCDIANASRDMKDNEKKAAQDAGLNLEGVVVAKDMIVPIVHPSNPLSEITTDQLKAIYMGEIKNWSELGGEDAEIVIISRDTSSGTYEVWESLVMKKENVTADALLQASNGAVANAVAQNEKAIGYVGVGFLSDKVKGLATNGVVPKVENVDQFPISRPLFMFINKDTITPTAKSYIDFVLSAEGQKLVVEAGYVSI